MTKEEKSPSCLCCKGTCDCEYACSHPHTEESCCTYPLEHKGCEQIKEAYYKGRNQTLAQVEKIIDKVEGYFMKPQVSFTCDKIKEEIKNLKEVGKK